MGRWTRDADRRDLNAALPGWEPWAEMCASCGRANPGYRHQDGMICEDCKTDEELRAQVTAGKSAR